MIGGTGLLGAPLALCLHQLGCRVDIVSTARRFSRATGIKSTQCDISQPGVAAPLLAELAPDVVINCAAVTNVDACESNIAAQRINAEWPRHLALAATASNTLYAHISTDCVFASRKGTALPGESMPPQPMNAYARQKVEAEAGVLEASDGNALVVRTNFFGWSPEPSRGLAAWALRELRAGRPVNGFSDVFFNPLYSEDAIDLLIDLLNADVRGLIHMLGSECLDKYSFICRLAAATGLEPASVRRGRLEDAKLKVARPLNTCLATARLEQVLQRTPPTAVDGIARMVRDERFMRSRLSGLETYPRDAG